MKPNQLAAAVLALYLPCLGVSAAPEPSDPSRQTPWGLYLDAREAGEMKQRLGDGVLFVDVREPIEIMFTGFTDMVDINVPFLQVDPTKWNSDKPVFAMERNPEFAARIARALAERSLDRSTPVILMCRSGGERGAPSARALVELGLEAVHVVVDGFEGDTQKNHRNGPWRLVNGWKNSGLPWSYSLNPQKIHIRPAQ